MIPELYHEVVPFKQLESDPPEKGNPVHPSTAQVLQYFSYEHLPEKLQRVSHPFCDLAESLAHELDGPELTVALRKLLESKDAAVRAALTPREN